MGTPPARAAAATDRVAMGSQRRGDLTADLLAIAHRGVRLRPAAEHAITGCQGSDSGACARECGRLLARYYRLRGELASLSLTGPLLQFRRELDTVLLCHQFFLHEAAVNGAANHGGRDLRAGLALQSEWLCDLRDEILDFMPHAEVVFRERARRP